MVPVRLSIPALAAAYCPVTGAGLEPLREEMLMIEPRSITRAAAWAAKKLHVTVPLQCLGTPDAGPLCVYFASDESSCVTGSVVQVDRGKPGAARVPDLSASPQQGRRGP